MGDGNDRAPRRTSIVSGGRRKVHTTFPDGREMVEEYDVRTEDLLVRKTRGKTILGAQQDWQWDVGKPASTAAMPASGIRESPHNPVLVRKDTHDTIEFRIRNLPYPQDVYDVSVDEVSQTIIIRTSNKKYFKRITVPDVQGLRTRDLTWHWGNNTLVMYYRKPADLIANEQKQRAEIARLDSAEHADGNEGRPGPNECKQQ
ncbi:Protein DPCD [Plasmodiophora brassicae]